MPGGRIRDAVKPIAELHQRVDEWLDKTPADMKAAIPCKRGCAWCCRQMVMTTIPEMMYVLSDVVYTEAGMHLLNKLAPEIEQRARESVKPGMTNVEWFRREVDCLFQKQKGKDWEFECLVYEKRPVACRGYYVVDTDPTTCTLPDLKVKCLDVTPLQEPEVIAVKAVARELRITPAPMPLPVSLHWALIGYFRGLGELRERMKRGYRATVKVGEDGVVQTG